MVDSFIDGFLEEENDRKILDKLLTYFENIDLEIDSFMNLLVSKLDQMVITWEQPWYQQSYCLTRPLKSEQNELEPCRTDRFSQAESDILDRNWKNFVKVYKVPDTPECFTNFKLPTKNAGTPLERVRQFVTAFLARGVKRSLYQVHKHLLRKYSFTRKGPCSEKEVRLLEICVKYCPKTACRVLSRVLRREPRYLYTKIEEIKNNCKKEPAQPCKKQPWTLKRSSELLNLILKYTGLSLSELKNKHIDKNVWDKIGKKINGNSARLREYWYHVLHVQLFVEEDLTSRRLSKQIYRKLHASPYQRWSDINWKELVKEFPDGCTSDFIYDMALRPFKYNNFHRNPLPEALEFAFKRIKKNKQRRRLRRLRLNEHGELEPLCKGLTNKPRIFA